LAVANEGAHTLDEVASVLGVSAEYIRRIEARALRKLRRTSLAAFERED
jgi:DNA-directed RNA polymerase sigma subunit (sigma70/sigma32)